MVGLETLGMEQCPRSHHVESLLSLSGNRLKLTRSKVPYGSVDKMRHMKKGRVTSLLLQICESPADQIALLTFTVRYKRDRRLRYLREPKK